MTDRPNVLLCIFDTLRADAPSCYGGAFDVRTPTIDRVASRGTMFENAFATGTFTPPSHGSLFSGQYPSGTGVLGGWPTMPESEPLLAEWLRDHGYDTFGIAGPPKMGSDTGMDRGFEGYYEVYDHVADRPSAAYLIQLMTEPLIRRDFLRTLRRGHDYFTELKFDRLRATLPELEPPFFAMANFTTVHAPYDPPRPYKRRATPTLSRPRIPIVEELREHTETLSDPDVRTERVLEAADGADSVTIKPRYYDDPSYLTEAELAILRAWYGASLRYLDDRLGAFLDWFERELDSDTLLILTSDHGEGFGEHGILYHGVFPHDEITHVPLIVSGPDVPSDERRHDLASLVDLFDTVCDLCDLPMSGTTDGRSLFAGDPRDAVFAERAITDIRSLSVADDVSEETLHAFEIGRKSIRTADHRYELRSDGSEQLYALPEERPVDEPDETVLATLRDRLVATIGDEFFDDRGDDDVEYRAGVERNLRQLGYLE